MAKKQDENSISELEQELQAIKSSLNELKKENVGAQRKSRTTSTKAKKTVQPKPQSVNGLQQTVADFLKQAKVERLERFQQYLTDVDASNQERKAHVHALKEACLQDKLSRLSWLKELQRTNEKSLQDFIERLESQGEKDRQKRYDFMNHIRGQLSETFGRPV